MDGWDGCCALRCPTLLYKKASRCLKKLRYALVTGEANREIVAGGTFIPVT